MRVLVATRSAGKLGELLELLAGTGMEPIDLRQAGIVETAHEEAIECFERFEENALAKARHFYGISGIPTFADDSGLAVDALGGRPGVRSKRYSGRSDLTGAALDGANNARLQEELAPHADRRARYICAAAYVDDERELVVRGETRGLILAVPRGDGGFGYDPYFESEELGRTFAEVDRVEKGRVSHRGRAFRALLDAVLARR
jgi:XTP/dITP diphosphohydrolase